ncbi:unnamed protein product [Vitrella brassicaformis CCMP3155]|uniref:Apple domain-containing protein n=1 Tax=Vitrella brassicaformis (strain CCMP3155) TaxID=1169540 RepID=A0A0G4EFA5_VITBC|nr:unnamed protein product [Vitrella brassicaformis CCMP3155]|eukprot:CEL94194.1 unnamed protein product [Vitrella brassicaformis CCMP3155]
MELHSCQAPALCLCACIIIACASAQVQYRPPATQIAVRQAATLEQLNGDCWQWNATLDGAFLQDPDPISTQKVWMPEQCANACKENTACMAWTFDWKYECSLLTNVSSVLAGSGSYGRRGAQDCRPLDEARPCDQNNVATLWNDATKQYLHKNLTVEECRQKCAEFPECRYFVRFSLSWVGRQGWACLPKYDAPDGLKMCQLGTTTGFIYGRACDPPTELLTPPEKDVEKLKSQNLWTSLELLRSAYPDFPVTQSSYDRIAGCGCYTPKKKPYYEPISDEPDKRLVIAKKRDALFYRKGEKTKEGSATLLEEVPTWLFSPRRCQILCQQHPRCTYWSTTNARCWLWADIQKWERGHSVSGPKFCPQDKLAEGLECNADYYRDVFSPLSLFVLEVKNVRVPFGDRCPVEINYSSLGWLLAGAILLLGSFVVACISRVYYERRTSIVLVMQASISLWDFITDVTFVARSYNEEMGWVFWVGLLHLIIITLANSLALIVLLRGGSRQSLHICKWMEELAQDRRNVIIIVLLFGSSFMHLGVLHLFASHLFGWKSMSLQLHIKSMLGFELLSLAEDIPQVALQVSYVMLSAGGQSIPSVTLMSLLTSLFQICKILLFVLRYALHSVLPSIATNRSKTEMVVGTEPSKAESVDSGVTL